LALLQREDPWERLLEEAPLVQVVAEEVVVGHLDLRPLQVKYWLRRALQLLKQQLLIEGIELSFINSSDLAIKSGLTCHAQVIF